MSKLTFGPAVAGATRIALWRLSRTRTLRHVTTFRPIDPVNAAAAGDEVVQTSGNYRVRVSTRYRSFRFPFGGREGVRRSALITFFA